MQTSREYSAPCSPRSIGSTSLPNAEIREGRYLARFAKSTEEIEAVLQLRFEVFNLELGEGLESSFATGQDRDEFDDCCHHLMILDTQEDRVVGTYRLQTGEIASDATAFYSSREFDLSPLPKGVLENSVELGRACIAKDHRNTRVLFLLWKGIAAYVAHNQKRYLFGCCSLTSQDPREGLRVFEHLEAHGHLHQQFHVSSREGLNCVCSAEQKESKTPQSTKDCSSEDAVLPKLFKIYLRFGAKVCGPPAIDREFKTIDFLVIFDVDGMDHRTHSLLFGA
jgi:putative hemolysin